MRESWAPIPGMEGYAVSDRGRVRSLDRFHTGSSGVRRLLLGHLLTPDAAQAVKIRRQSHKVAHLVLLAFAGPCPPGMECCHWNDIQTDNRLVNLRWDTSSANKFDMVRNGNHACARREACPRSHPLVSPNLVASVRRAGRRQCRACHRANAAMRALKAKGVAVDFQQLSDKYFNELMEAA